MNVDERALASDRRASTPEEVDAVKLRILDFAQNRNQFTMQEVYDLGDVPDLTMYVAFHDLVADGLLKGPSIYDRLYSGFGGHQSYAYEVPK